jgi:hypothetical protein
MVMLPAVTFAIVTHSFTITGGPLVCPGLVPGASNYLKNLIGILFKMLTSSREIMIIIHPYPHRGFIGLRRIADCNSSA